MSQLSGAPLLGKLLTLPTNIRLDWNTSLLGTLGNYGRTFYITLAPGYVINAV
jgi:hypothetical protein